jgi:hypothetical protein
MLNEVKHLPEITPQRIVMLNEVKHLSERQRIIVIFGETSVIDEDTPVSTSKQ